MATGNYRSRESLDYIQYFTSKGLGLYILKVWNIGLGHNPLTGMCACLAVLLKASNAWGKTLAHFLLSAPSQSYNFAFWIWQIWNIVNKVNESVGVLKEIMIKIIAYNHKCSVGLKGNWNDLYFIRTDISNILRFVRIFQK